MENNNINKDWILILTKAMENVFNKKIKDLNYIYHIKGKITEYVGGKQYKISYNSQTITAMNYRDLTLEIGNVVDVLYSNSDPTYRVINFKY